MTVAAFTGVHAVVLDIEGTTSASAYVYDVLFPYAAQRFDVWLRDHADEPETQQIVTDVAIEIGVTDPSNEQVLAALRQWVAEDRKVTPLKTLQGLIWEQGFACGELQSHFFADALDAIRAWHDAGVALYVYSSGSVLAQRNWYAHTPLGDLSPWIAGYFDTANAGPKREATSYTTIAQAIHRAPASLLFCTDVIAECEAAIDAGWQVVRVRRMDEPHSVNDAAGISEVPVMTDITLAP